MQTHTGPLQSLPASPAELDLVDADPDAALDHLTALAADMFDAPMALISLVDGERHAFKAKVGLALASVSRDISFCEHVLRTPDVLVVPDTLDDPRFRNNPFVIDEPYARFYAGAPLFYGDQPIGAMCILDIHPRRDFDARDQRRLARLADSVSAVLSLRKDTSVSKAAVKKLQETQRKLELMEEVAGVGYWHLKIAQAECFWSRGVYAIHGLNRDSYQPEMHTAIDLFHPDDRESLRACITQSMATGEDFTFKLRLMRADGEERIVYSKGGAEFDSCGKPEFLFGILVDVTEQSRLADTLRAAKETADAHHQAKSDFLSNMSHEIRTPLTTILGYANLLKSIENLPKDARHYIGRINKAGEALLSLVTDVLDFSKLEAGQVVLDPQPTDLKTLAADVIDQFMALTETRHVTIGFDYDDRLPVWLMLDDVRIRQVLYNLVGNACKFTHDGFVNLTIRPVKDWVRVAVQDSGPGLTPDQQARLFTRFNQVDNSINRKYGGSGLGLSICCEIVRLMKGDIGVSSEPGHGSCFWFEIPVMAAQEPAPVLPHQDLRPLFLEDRKVLIVDDHPINRELIRLLLKDYGFQVFEACDGAQALEICEKTYFDLVFMDIQMPVLDGIAATRQLRERGGPHCPGAIVALSAATQTKLVDDTRGQGFDHILCKPIDLPQFYATLHRSLDNTTGTPIVLAC